MIHPFISPLLKERGKVIGVASGLSRAITTAGWPRCGGRTGEQGGSRVSVVLPCPIPLPIAGEGGGALGGWFASPMLCLAPETD